MVDFSPKARRKATADEIVVQEIVRTLVERLRPRRLILFGSRARGDARRDSDYDVAVELEGAIEQPIELTGEILEYFPAGSAWELNVFLRSAGEIDRDADDPGSIDWDIVREGRLLYAAEGVSRDLRPSPDSQRLVRERPHDVPRSVQRWTKRASEDLGSAERLLSPIPLSSSVCFHAQQAAEKYLKALVIRLGVRPKRTHKLVDLLRAARKTGAGLPGLDADCALLTPYAITGRYGDDDAFDAARAHDAVTAATRISQAILPLLQ